MNQKNRMNQRTKKPIRLSGHARQRLSFRGCNEAEVIETILTSVWRAAEGNRLECWKSFVYNKEWNRKVYSTKEIRPIFVEEKNEIVVVTVYVYYH